MAAYDYRCDICDLIFELHHPMAETLDYTHCIDEECQGLLHKVFTPTPSIFKGGGWGKVYGTWKSKGDR